MLLIERATLLLWKGFFLVNSIQSEALYLRRKLLGRCGQCAARPAAKLSQIGWSPRKSPFLCGACAEAYVEYWKTR